MEAFTKVKYESEPQHAIKLVIVVNKRPGGRGLSAKS